MQTLAFLWYELKAARRHVKEAVAESELCTKADFSLLIRPSDSKVIDEASPSRHVPLRWIAQEENGVGCRPFLRERC